MALDGTYTGLLESLAGWVDRQDMTARWPDMVALAEADMNDKLRVRQMMKRAQATLDGTSDRFPLPTDWLETVNVEVVGGYPDSKLEYQPPAYVDKVRDDAALGVAYGAYTHPTVYYYSGTEIQVAPMQVSWAPLTLEMVYYAKLPTVITNGTNWLLTRRPDAYLYGALRHAAPYLIEDERVPLWDAAYSAAIQALNDADDKANVSGSPLRRRVKPLAL